MDIGSLSSAIALASFLALLIPLTLIGVVVIAVVSNRAEPDPTGRRPYAVYLYAASFVTLFVTLFAAFGIVARLCSLIGSGGHGEDDFGFDDGSGSDSSSDGSDGGVSSYTGMPSRYLVFVRAAASHPVGDAVTRDALRFLILAVIAGVALLLHLRAAGRISADDPTRTGPVGRVRASYTAAVAFVCVLITIVSVVVVGYAILDLFSPTIFGSGDKRVYALRTIIPAAFLAVAAFGILVGHLRSTPPGQRPRFRLPKPAPAVPPVPPGPTDLGGYGGYQPPAAPPAPPAPPRPAGPPAGGPPERPRPTPGR